MPETKCSEHQWIAVPLTDGRHVVLCQRCAEQACVVPASDVPRVLPLPFVPWVPQPNPWWQPFNPLMYLAPGGYSDCGAQTIVMNDATVPKALSEPLRGA